LRGGDHVLAVASREKLAWVREDLGGDAGGIELVDAAPFYERHGPMFQAVLAQLERHGTPGRGRVRIVAEQALACRHPADVRAYLRYEAASNVAYERYDAAVLCPYDAEGLGDEILRAALQTHPRVLERDRLRDSESFIDPRAFIRASAVGTAPPERVAAYRLERPEDIAGARMLIRDRGEAAGLGCPTIEDLTLAVTEVASNALIHGDGPRQLWNYVDEGHLVCQIRDAGGGLRDPLAGHLPPDRRGTGGRGLWLAHQLCDSVEVATRATGTDVYLRTRLPGAG
jgi:anti-sigma regulatory factor (Ser/Thr protein kinase)